MTAPYFPFDIVEDAARVALREFRAPTHLGEMSFWHQGALSNQATVFLHGVGMDWSFWTPLISVADEKRQDRSHWVFADIPGFGRSDPILRPVSLFDVGCAVVEGLAFLGVDRFTLVGHSMGGFLALDMAGSFPSQIVRVVSSSGAYATIVDIVNDPARSAIRFPTAYSIYTGLRALNGFGRFAQPLLHFTAATGIAKVALRKVVAHPCKVKPSMMTALANGVRPSSFRYAEATGVGYSTSEQWASIHIPLLATFGGADFLVGQRDAGQLVASNPMAQICWIDDAGHFVPVERPYEFFENVRRWL